MALVVCGIGLSLSSAHMFDGGGCNLDVGRGLVSRTRTVGCEIAGCRRRPPGSVLSVGRGRAYGGACACRCRLEQGCVGVVRHLLCRFSDGVGTLADSARRLEWVDLDQDVLYARARVASGGLRSSDGFDHLVNLCLSELRLIEVLAHGCMERGAGAVGEAAVPGRIMGRLVIIFWWSFG